MFPKRLNWIRKQLCMTAQAMADWLHVSVRTYRNYESGKTEPSLSFLIKIADRLNLSTDYLLCRDQWLEEHAAAHLIGPQDCPKFESSRE